MYRDNDLEWAGLLAYARGAGARDYGEAQSWVVEALARGVYTTYDRSPYDMTDAYHRLDALAGMYLSARDA